jgi:hypothetical protein
VSGRAPMERPLDPRVQVLVVPPSDPRAAGHAELQGIGTGEDRPPMAELAARPWLAQDAAVRGCALTTLGLRVYAGHPELTLLNFPTALAEAGVRLLKELGSYVLAGGVLVDGELMQMGEGLPRLVGFLEVPADAEGGESMLRVVLLA